MRIEAIRTAHFSLEMRRPMRTAIHATSHTENVLVEVHAGGLAGQGAALAFSPGQARAVRHALLDLAEGLEGEDAGQVRALWARGWQRLNFTGQSGIGVLALAALDTALWDLLARAAGMPLHRLLGSARAELPVYAQGGWLADPVEHVVEEALDFQAQGFRHYKMRVGSPDWRADLRRVERVRDALDDDMRLMVDANQGWTVLDALAAARELDQLDVYWLEEPVDAGELDGGARVAAASATPVAAGETMFGTAGFRTLIERRLASILMPDLQHCAGPTGFLRVAAQAELAGLPISSHLFTEASVHLLAAIPGALLVEYMPGWWDDLFDTPPAIAGGLIRPPDGPGLGVRFGEQAARTLERV